MSGRRVDEIGLEELEQLIAARRAARARGEETRVAKSTRMRRITARLAGVGLTLLEVAVVVALVYSVVGWARTRQDVNQASVAAMVRILPTPTTVPSVAVDFVPSGHTPPTSPGGPQPIEASVPEHLRALVDVPTPVSLPTVVPQPEQPVWISIPSINVEAPVVQGDDWDSLMLGVGHHIGSANPGERSNMVLSAHNDIFAEIFRDLPDMQLEDEIIVKTQNRTYHYVVKARRIIEPTQVEVMQPTRSGVVTLISCYPYLIDTHRIVVIGELVENGSSG